MKLTSAALTAAATTHLTLDRAQGALVPHIEEYELVYRLGFLSGASWATGLAIEKLAPEVKP